MPAPHGSLGDALQRFLLGELGQDTGYEHLGDAVVLDWYVQNTCRFMMDPMKAVAGVHGLDRYGENLRNRFRDFRSVLTESFTPLALSAVKYAGVFLLSKITGDALMCEMRMADLETTVKDEA